MKTIFANCSRITHTTLSLRCGIQSPLSLHLHRTISFHNMAHQPNNKTANQEPLFNPAKYPPFPTDIPNVVKLETYSLARLEAGDKEHQDALFETCKARGFFYLDLNDSSAQEMQQDADSLARLAEKVHKLPREEQDKYPMEGGLFGYVQILPAILSLLPSLLSLFLFQISSPCS